MHYQLIKRHERLDIPHLKWLDKHTYRVIESIHAKESAAVRNELWLYLDLPRFEWPVVWCEEEVVPISTTGHRRSQGFGPVTSPVGPTTSIRSASAAGAPTATSGATPPASLPKPGGPLLDRSLFTLPDPEADRENPIEAKHRRLVRAQRSRRRGLESSALMGGASLALVRDLKPDKKARDEIEEILSSPPSRELTDKESDLLWTYRFYLTKSPRGLTKFLKAVSWEDRVESKAAVETMLPLWGGATVVTAEGRLPGEALPGTSTSSVEIGDVLELLGPACKSMDKAVRKWAVDRLAERADSELSLYLLQLVQAMKLDERADEMDEGRSKTASTTSRNRPVSTATSSDATSAAGSDLGALTEFLISRSLASASVQANNTADTAASHLPHQGASSFLITFYWYISVECSDDRWGLLYKRVRRRLERGLEHEGEAGKHCLSVIRRQEKMVSRLSEIAKSLRISKDGRPKKIEKLQEWIKDEKALGLHLAEDSSNHNADDERSTSSLLPLPLDAAFRARRINTAACSVFKSNLYPLLIWFEADTETTPGHDSDTTPPKPQEYALIFKSGDDLRQDQLVLQLFQLMDRLLLNENLDLKMTPYRVLATAPKEGMVQFIKSKTLATIVNEYGTLNEYLRKSGEGEGGSMEDKMDRFVRSCAGYCVVTYILGVGDRHLDNLLLSPDGRFFHGEWQRECRPDTAPWIRSNTDTVRCDANESPTQSTLGIS